MLGVGKHLAESFPKTMRTVRYWHTLWLVVEHSSPENRPQRCVIYIVVYTGVSSAIGFGRVLYTTGAQRWQ